MDRRHIVKKVRIYKSHRLVLPKTMSKESKKTQEKNNNVIKKDNDMTMEEKIDKMQNVLQGEDNSKIKKIKKDKSLIERADNTKIVMVDDEKMLLKD